MFRLLHVSRAATTTKSILSSMPVSSMSVIVSLTRVLTLPLQMLPAFQSRRFSSAAKSASTAPSNDDSSSSSTTSSSTASSSGTKAMPRNIVLTTADDPRARPLMNLIDDEQERMLNMLDDVAANPNAEAMAKIEELAANLDIQHELVQREIAEIEASPEWIEYELISEETRERITDEWCASPEPVTKHTVAALHKRLKDAELEIQEFYRQKRFRRLQREEEQQQRKLASQAARQQQPEQQELQSSSSSTTTTAAGAAASNLQHNDGKPSQPHSPTAASDSSELAIKNNNASNDANNFEQNGSGRSSTNSNANRNEYVIKTSNLIAKLLDENKPAKRIRRTKQEQQNIVASSAAATTTTTTSTTTSTVTAAATTTTNANANAAATTSIISKRIRRTYDELREAKAAAVALHKQQADSKTDSRKRIRRTKKKILEDEQ